MRFVKATTRAVTALCLLLAAGAFLSLGFKKQESPAQARYIPFGERDRQENYRISPYDSLIRAWSDSAGLDWRLVSAVVYHESHFRHDALSKRGATGLMQMMPSTARAFGADSLLDPSQNVMAGTRYLKSLFYRYRGVAANTTEQQKMMLAAYNAGGGRMTDIINYARWKGVDPGYWDNLAGVIPEMRSDSILAVDTVKLGKFQGFETIEYVKAVMARYGHYTRIAP